MKVLVFGLGYVGSVTAACLASVGHDVVGIDVDARKVEAISARRSPILEHGLDRLIAEAVPTGRLRATTDGLAELADADVSIVCVGTPSSRNGALDTRHVEVVCRQIGGALAARRPGHVVVIRSTVLPGTIASTVVPILEEASGHRAGDHFGVAMCPEFLREATSIADFFDPPFTVVGTEHDDAHQRLVELFGFLDAPLIRVDAASAEAIKYACNAFHAVKVAFANEIGRFCHQSGADSRAVMEVFCQDDRLNLSSYYLRPGFSFGGSCLPKDVRAVVHQSRHFDLDLPLLASLLPSNEQHLRAAVERVLASGARTVALLGLSFKGGTDDLRESPYVELAEVLIGKGIDLRIHDPSVDPASLRGTNLNFVAERLPHLAQLLAPDAGGALAGAACAVVASTDGALQDALVACPPPLTLDLTGRLRPEVEALPGFEGLAW